MAKDKPITEAQREHKWEVEEAARALTRAEEIKRDPKLYREAIEHLKEQAASIIENIQDAEGGKMPADFEKCVKDGGTVVTHPVKGDRYMRICIDKQGNSHAGEVKKKKQK